MATCLLRHTRINTEKMVHTNMEEAIKFRWRWLVHTQTLLMEDSDEKSSMMIWNIAHTTKPNSKLLCRFDAGNMNSQQQLWKQKDILVISLVIPNKCHDDGSVYTAVYTYKKNNSVEPRQGHQWPCGYSGFLTKVLNYSKATRWWCGIFCSRHARMHHASCARGWWWWLLVHQQFISITSIRLKTC